MTLNERESPQVSGKWLWPDSMDALVAAPAYHTRLFENERVRVLHTHIPAGAFVPVHTHRHPAVAYVLSHSHFVRRDHDGNVLFDSRRSSKVPDLHSAHWLAPLPPHTVENVGASEISILIVEIKDGAATGTP